MCKWSLYEWRHMCRSSEPVRLYLWCWIWRHPLWNRYLSQQYTYSYMYLSVATLNHRCLTDGARDGLLVGLPFPGTGFTVPGIDNNHFVPKLIVWQTVSAFIILPSVFLFTNCLFQHRLGMATCTRLIQNLHTKLRIISNWLPRCIWRRGRKTCDLYNGPLLCLWFWIAVGVQVIIVKMAVLLISHVIHIFLHYHCVAIFPLKLHFHTKHCGLSYSIDVV